MCPQPVLVRLSGAAERQGLQVGLGRSRMQRREVGMGEGERLVRERLMELRALCRRFGVAQLELFGSALRDDFDFATSDLDFLVRLEPPAGVGYADAYFGLKEGLEELFQRSVDLVSIGAVKNPHLREAIERSKRTLYAA